MKYAEHAESVSARSGREMLLAMVDSADAVMQTSWETMTNTFDSVARGKPLVFALETGCPAGAAPSPGSSGRCVPAQDTVLEAEVNSQGSAGIKRLRHINGGFVMGRAWAMAMLWREVAQNHRNISCCYRGKLNPQLGMGRFAALHPEMALLEKDRARGDNEFDLHYELHSRPPNTLNFGGPKYIYNQVRNLVSS
ncbi:MAG: hypothetical protein SGPRY_007811 [Prymnesium sp.]